VAIAGSLAHTDVVRRFCACVCLVGVAACTVDSEDGATSLGSTTVPVMTTTTTVGTTTTSTTATSTTTSDSATTDASETSAESSPPETSETQSADDSSGTESGPDEQPVDGLYSACESAVECFGATVCVLVMGSLGYCSNNCTIPSDCGPPPAGTATQACVAASVGGADMMVCALDCSGGATCPGGMECLPLGATMVCV